MRRTLAPVDQARAGRVVVVGELLPVGDGWGGELVPLHLLLLNSQVSAHNFEIDIASTIKMRTKLCSSSQMAVLAFILLLSHSSNLKCWVHGGNPTNTVH